MEKFAERFKELIGNESINSLAKKSVYLNRLCRDTLCVKEKSE